MKNLPILLVMVLLTGLLATTPCLAQNQYGALAAGADGSVGWAADYRTQAGANARALAECGGHCVVKVEFWNTCAAYAQAGNGSSGWAYGPNRASAENLAMRYCRQYGGTDCSVWVWACTSR